MTTIDHHQEIVTARIAGLCYLLLAISGVFGFIVLHPQVFVADPRETLIRLTDLEATSRARLLLEFAVIISQALTAVWFYRLFRTINEWAAWAVGIWGMINCVAILISAITMASAIEVAHSTFYSIEDKSILIGLSNILIANAWKVGGLFFGLWLIPLGYLVTSSRRMPLWLGRTLILGGTGYLLSVVAISLGGSGWVSDVLVVPATVGEFWMIGYLLVYGIRAAASEPAS
ncbi:MAG: hypothetical protein HBSIN02_07840 [Bacteroidia bacterium]|nr:MAG: hypothetical protein HBSIN02_07840 [Bacteroidia bacterium]